MPPPTKLSFDASGAEAAIESVINLFTRYNATLDRVTHSHVEIDASGKVVKATLEALTRGGKSFFVELENMGTGLEVVGTKAKNTETSLQKLKKQIEQNNQAIKASEFLQAKSAGLDKDVKVKDRLGLDRLQDQMVNLVRQGKLTAKELENVYRIVEGGGKGKFHADPGLEAARQKIIAYRLEFDKLNQTEVKNRKIAADIKTSKAVIDSFRSRVLSGSSVTELLGFDRSAQSLLNFVRVGKISATDFQDIFRKIEAGAKDTFLQKIPEDVRLGVVTMTRELDRLYDKQGKAARVSSGKTNARFVPDNIRAIFGDLPSNATQRSSDIVTNNAAKIKAAFETGKLDATTFGDVVTAVTTKTGSSFTGMAGTAQRALQRIKNEYDRLAESAKKASEEQETQAKREKLATVVGRFIQKRYGNQDFDERGLNAYYTQVARIQDLIRKGSLDRGGFMEAFKAFNSGEGPLAAGAEKARRSLAGISGAIRETAERAESLTPVLAGLGRVLWAQILYDSLSQITDEFGRIAEQAAEFQQHIALIQTISQDADLSFRQWSEGIAKVSDELGRPIIDVAIAGYDSLSNQVTRAADTFDFLRTAGSFARITNSSVKDSVDLLSSALNAFQIPTSDANRVAASFFTTIDLGRVKAQELGGTFGRVAVYAHSLGISLEELGGAISVISRQGVEAQTTQTLLNNVFQKLLNPTKQLQDLYDKLGVGTGEAFVKTYGFVGALEKLKEAAGGSKAVIADYFNEIRGFQGANTLIDRLDDLKSDIEQHLNSGPKVDIAKALFKQNAGQQFVDEMNKIVNFFRTGFETTVLESVIKVTNAVGGLSNIFKVSFHAVWEATKLATTSAIGFALVWGTFQLPAIVAAMPAMLAAITASTAAATSAMTVFLSNPVILAAAAGVAIGSVIKQLAESHSKMVQLAEDAKKVARENIEADRKIFSEDLLNRRKEFEKGLNDTQKKILIVAQTAQKELSSVAEAQKKLGKEIGDSVQNGLDLVLNNIKRIARELEQTQHKAVENAKKARADIRESFTDQRSTKFDIAKKAIDVARANAEARGQDTSGFDGQERVLYQKRIKQFGSEIVLATKAGDVQKVNELFKERLRLLEEMATATKTVPVYGIDQSGNVQQLGQATALKHLGVEQQISSEYAKQRRWLDQIAKLEDAKAEKARKAVEEEKKRVEQLEDLAKKIGKFDPFNEKGELDLTKYKTAGEALKELNKLQEQFLNVSASAKDPGATLATLKTFADMRNQLRVEFAKQQTNARDQLGTYGRIQQVNHFRDQALEAPARALESFDSLSRKVTETNEKMLRLKSAAREVFLTIAGNVHDNGIESFGAAGGLGKRLGLIGPTEATNLLNKAAGSFGQGKFAQALSDLETYEKELEKTGHLQDIAFPETNDKPAQTAKQAITTLRAFINEALKTEKTGAGTTILDSFIEKSKEVDPVVVKVEEKFKEMGLVGVDSVKPVAEAIAGTTGKLDALIEKLDAATSAWQKLNQESKAQGLPSITPPTVGTKSMGGYVGHLAAGGQMSSFMSDFWSGMYAKGTDVIPTMLGKDEIVMNARASGKWAPQLFAMNHDFTPNMTSKAGDTNNIHVHTTVNVAKGGNDDIQRIVQGINRAARRGQLTVKGS